MMYTVLTQSIAKKGGKCGKCGPWISQRHQASAASSAPAIDTPQKQNWPETVYGRRSEWRGWGSSARSEPDPHLSLPAVLSSPDFWELVIASDAASNRTKRCEDGCNARPARAMCACAVRFASCRCASPKENRGIIAS
jgi:hypothetical protein